jgi:hypothetical protein
VIARHQAQDAPVRLDPRFNIPEPPKRPHLSKEDCWAL